MATVRAATAARLFVLDRPTFLAGVSAHARSTSAAEQLGPSACTRRSRWRRDGG